ncbi:hypothetical protein HAX54_046287 [Datura stramonium]|uniref:Uncharacterized protein n=1 Tax=Datura stramonium TaxID=4076 RepID=A0ABS8WKK0_DATST|nr:hypothetical protein [Datura stramonium]
MRKVRKEGRSFSAVLGDFGTELTRLVLWFVLTEVHKEQEGHKMSSKWSRENLELVRSIALEFDPRNPILSRVPLELGEIEEEQTARNLAKLHLEGEIPPDIELVIL